MADKTPSSPTTAEDSGNNQTDHSDSGDGNTNDNPDDSATGDSSTTLSSAQISANRPVVCFGAQAFGNQTPSVMRASVTNLGDMPLTISSISLTDSSGPFTVSDLSQKVLKKGGLSYFEVSYLPDSPHLSRSSLKIESDDPMQPTLLLPVVGQSVLPYHMRLLPRHTHYLWNNNCGSPLWITVLNYGDAPLLIRDVQLATDSSDLSLSNTGSLPWLVAAMSGLQIYLGFSPTDKVDDVATITITPDNSLLQTLVGTVRTHFTPDVACGS